MSKPIGFILTITGLVLAVWFIQILMVPQPAPLQAFIVAALAVAMVSVGVRYLLKKSKPKRPKPETKKEP